MAKTTHPDKCWEFCFVFRNSQNLLIRLYGTYLFIYLHTLKVLPRQAAPPYHSRAQRKFDSNVAHFDNFHEIRKCPKLANSFQECFMASFTALYDLPFAKVSRPGHSITLRNSTTHMKFQSKITFFNFTRNLLWQSQIIIQKFRKRTQFPST